ncbi:hypothetical protein DL96DRAFT_1598673 [Flagelloscypha sp. PMI_526]|nr:hypothetical protein DL96DRAFT_1598673 [Flagelloscypha sp. PMI_526]
MIHIFWHSSIFLTLLFRLFRPPSTPTDVARAPATVAILAVAKPASASAKRSLSLCCFKIQMLPAQNSVVYVEMNIFV